MKPFSRIIITIVSLLVGCSKPTAESTCQKFNSVGLVGECAVAEPALVNMLAKERLKAKTKNEESCLILSFDDEQKYSATAQAFKDFEFIAGSNSHGNQNKLIFVHCDRNLPAEDWQKIKNIINSL